LDDFGPEVLTAEQRRHLLEIVEDMWNPMQDIDIGFDLSFIRLNTAFAGTAVLGSLGTVFQSNAFGRPSGLYIGATSIAS
jgi:hypothetical protein